MNSVWVSCAVVREFANPVQNQIHNFFANGVVTSCKLVVEMCCWQFQTATVKRNEKCLSLACQAGKQCKECARYIITFCKICRRMQTGRNFASQITSCKVVGRVLFSRNQLFRMGELAVCACAHLVNHRRFLWASDCWIRRRFGPQIITNMVLRHNRKFTR